MKRSYTIFFASLTAVICLSSSALPEDKGNHASREIAGNGPSRLIDRAVNPPHGGFRDRTQEIVRDALTLIDRNEREGSPLDQHWYAFRRLGENLDQVLSTKEVRFYGGRETEVMNAIGGQYVSVTPIEPDQDSGEMRLFAAQRNTDSRDLLIIGQNGREVALKTVCRLAYLFKFLDERSTRAFPGGLDSFLSRVRVYLSPVSPRQEFISFFHQYGITDPDTVIIGFEADARAVLKQNGIAAPERYSNDSLRVNWYPTANSKKVLLVSINGNRIFASRAGELMQAMFETFHLPPRSVIFFGSAGAIDSADLIGRIVAPTVVVNDVYDNPVGTERKLAHIIRNRAAMMLPVKTAHLSVESMLVETTKWAKETKNNRITTVDQELYHVINAINGSPYSANIRVFVSLLVTDNVSPIRAHHRATLKHAEDVIAQTAATRRKFLAKLMAEAGIIPYPNIGASTDGGNLPSFTPAGHADISQPISW